MTEYIVQHNNEYYAFKSSTKEGCLKIANRMFPEHSEGVYVGQDELYPCHVSYYVTDNLY